MKKLLMMKMSPTDLDKQGTDQYDSKDSSDIFLGPVAEDDFMRLQRDFYEKYGEHKELSQHVWKAMHTTFPTASTSTIVRQLSTGENGEILEPSIIR